MQTPLSTFKRRELEGIGVDFTSHRSGLPGDAIVRDRDGGTTFYGTPLDLLTYTAPSVKMTRQKDGFIKHGPHNFILQSEDTDTTWAVSQLTTSVNVALAPDGTMTADKIIDNTADAFHILRQTTSKVEGLTYRLSVYAKQDDLSGLMILDVNAGTGSGNVRFDLSAGTILGAGNGSVVGDGTIEDVGVLRLAISTLDLTMTN